MDIEITKSDLQRILSLCQLVAAKRTTMPILSCVHLTAANGKLTARATDLYMAVTAEAACNVKKGGTAAVKADDLAARIKTMPTGPVTISVTERAMVIKGNGSARKHTMNVAPADDYPPETAPTSDEKRIIIRGPALVELVARTKFAATEDDSIPSRNAVILIAEGTELAAWGADSWGMARCTALLEEPAPDVTVLIPLASSGVLARVCEDAAFATAQLAISEGQMRIIGDGAVFTTKLTSAVPPGLQHMLGHCEKGLTVHMRAPRTGLIDAVAAASLSSEAVRSGIDLRLDGTKLRLSSESSASGASFDELDVGGDGGSAHIVIAKEKLLLVLGSAGGDEVTVSCSDELGPVMVRGDRFAAVIMPMRQ